MIVNVMQILYLLLAKKNVNLAVINALPVLELLKTVMIVHTQLEFWLQIATVMEL